MRLNIWMYELWKMYKNKDLNLSWADKMYLNFFSSILENVNFLRYFS